MNTVEPLVETDVSSSMRIEDIYVNVWTAMPSADSLLAVSDAERGMPIGYRSLEIIERMDSLTFQKGVRELMQRVGAEFAGKPAKNVFVLRAGGFAGVVVHGLAGILNAVGLKTPVHTELDAAIHELLQGAVSSPPASVVLPLVEAHIARHVARIPRR